MNSKLFTYQQISPLKNTCFDQQWLLESNGDKAHLAHAPTGSSPSGVFPSYLSTTFLLANAIPQTLLPIKLWWHGSSPFFWRRKLTLQHCTFLDCSLFPFLLATAYGCFHEFLLVSEFSWIVFPIIPLRNYAVLVMITWLRYMIENKK